MKADAEGGTPAAAATLPPVAPAGRRGRRWRLAVTTVVFGVLLLGTLRGQDDDFPFGPFRMYATRQSLDGTASWYRIEAVTDRGELVFVPGADYGMRRAELEGQIPRFEARPALLGDLAVAYERRRPGAPRLVEIHLVQRRQRLHGGQPVGTPTDRLVASWSR